MPTEERGDIANVTPTGWEYNGISNNNTYDFVDGEYVYNRCHLIGFQLAGENDNELNLITGTRYMNIDGMLDFENMVADYVEESENHVMYRVTPIFTGFNYVADGVLMEALSVEDNGRAIKFCIFAYNVQPGVYIDYFTGVNVKSGDPLPPVGDSDEKIDGEGGDETIVVYIVNIKSKKFHIPGKSCAESISEENRESFSGSREDAIAEGYSPCGICKP
jgi:DNA-entry nuclease